MADISAPVTASGDKIDPADVILYDETDSLPINAATTHATSIDETQALLGQSDTALVPENLGTAVLDIDSNHDTAGLDDIDWNVHEQPIEDMSVVHTEPDNDPHASVSAVDVHMDVESHLAEDEVLLDEDDPADDYHIDMSAEDPATAGNYPETSAPTETEQVNADADVDVSFQDANAHGSSLQDDAQDQFDEITYDEDEDQEAASASSAHSNHEGYESPFDGAQQEAEIMEGAEETEVHQAANTGGDLEDEESVDEDVAEEVQQDSDDEEPVIIREVQILPDEDTKDEDEDEDEDDEDDSALFDIPTVTVCYRNEEFPLFRGAPGAGKKMPFFSTLTPLDYTIDLLLSSFRQELSEEVAPNDEIVFQIDELGLEYAESTQRDAMTGVNLRQLLEIFDQLVKNQDPGRHRPLYTYLFTRPSPAKRLDSLIEDAFAGKGLDEVVHYFHPSSHHSATDDEIDAAVEDESDEESDEHASANPTVSADDEEDYEESAQDEEAGEDEDFDQEEIETAPRPDHRLSVGDDDGDDDDDDQEDDDAEDRSSSRNDESGQPSPAGVEQPLDTSNDIGTVDLTDEDQALFTTFNDNPDDEQLELDFPREAEDFDATALETNGIEDDYLNLADDAPGVDEAGKVTTATSATETLNGEDEIDFDNDFNDQAALPTDQPAGEDNEEIQWGEGDDQQAGQSLGSKRPRDEEEDDVDDGAENDVKRRRS